MSVSVDGYLTAYEALEMMQDPNRLQSLGEILAMTSPETQRELLEDVDMEALQYDWNFWGRPKQIIPDEPYSNVHLALMGRGWGKLSDTETPLFIIRDGALKRSTIGNVQVGDKVFDENGLPCNVLAKSDVETPEVAYKLTFSDGAQIIASSTHQWVTWTHQERKQYGRSDSGAVSAGMDQDDYPRDWANYTIPKLQPTDSKRLRWSDAEIAIIVDAINKGKTPKEVHAVMAYRTRGAIYGVFDIVKKGYVPEELGIKIPIRTTQAIVDTLNYGKRGDTNHCIPTARALQMPEDPHRYSRYLYGYWLGDGSTGSSDFAVGAEDLSEFLKNVQAEGHEVTSAHRNGITVNIHKYKSKDLKVILGGDCQKDGVPSFISDSEENRLAILQGLLDSDGFIHSDSGYIEFCNTRKNIADLVMFLATSLGQKPVMLTGEATLYGRVTGPKYRVTWRPTRPDFFRLPRKAARFKPLGSQSRRNFSRMIINAERVESVPMQCIEVDSPNNMYLLGDGMIPTHNSRMASEWLRSKAMKKPQTRLLVLGRTAADVRDVMVTGQSGILSIPQPEEEKPHYKVNESKVVWPNGSEMLLKSAEKPDGLRGAQAEFSVCDELAAFTPFVGADGLTAFDNLRIATRLGDAPQLLVTTTPKRVQSLRDLLAEAEEKGPGFVRVVKGSTLENSSNLASVYLDVLTGATEGTAMYQQEIMGEMLDDDMEGVLWMPDDIHVVPMDESDRMRFGVRVVGVDPSVAENPKDECGIVVVGAMPGEPIHRRKAYVLEDATIKGSPEAWARAVVDAAHKWKAHGIVVEKNQGDHLVTMALKAIDPTLKIFPVHAGLSKATRAEPVAIRYQQGRVIHTESFPVLETQMTTWQPGITKKSPDRVDALVHAITSVLLAPPKGLLRAPLRLQQATGTVPLGGIGTGSARTWGTYGR